ncbi:MAG: thioredoxin family protein [Chlamydiae bacterium]|nr:thioredoxin family protein [Chlamydiota bacterium]
MRFKLGIFLLCSLFRTVVAAVEPFEVAEKRAKEENKPLMIFFMGSGWCHWCEEMKKKILSKRDFLRNVENDFILLEVDFPRGSGKNKNEMTYKKRFGVGRYPTVVIYDPRSDKMFRESGFRDISPREYAIRLKEKFFETELGSVQIGKGGFWGASSNRELDKNSIEQANKSIQYSKGRKIEPKQESRHVKKPQTDGFEIDAGVPLYEWIQKSLEGAPIESTKETKVKTAHKEQPLRWEKYPKGAVLRVKSTKKLKKVEPQLIRIGFGGNWWVLKSR